MSTTPWSRRSWPRTMGFIWSRDTECAETTRCARKVNHPASESSDAMIVRALAADNAEIDNCDRVTVDSVQGQRLQAASRVQQTLLSATYREILERRLGGEPDRFRPGGGHGTHAVRLLRGRDEQGVPQPGGRSRRAQRGDRPASRRKPGPVLDGREQGTDVLELKGSDCTRSVEAVQVLLSHRRCGRRSSRSWRSWSTIRRRWMSDGILRRSRRRALRSDRVRRGRRRRILTSAAPTVTKGDVDCCRRGLDVRGREDPSALRPGVGAATVDPENALAKWRIGHRKPRRRPKVRYCYQSPWRDPQCGYLSESSHRTRSIAALTASTDQLAGKDDGNATGLVPVAKSCIWVIPKPRRPEAWSDGCCLVAR